MNKFILVAMNRKNHTQEELDENYTAAVAVVLAVAAAYTAADDATYAACAAYDAYDAAAEYWINRYFERTGEDKQLYVNEIERINNMKTVMGASMVGKPSQPVFTQAMADNGELPQVGSKCDFETTFFTAATSNKGTCEILAYHGGKVWINIIDFDCVINLNVIDFKPIDTRTDKEKAIDAIDKLITDAYQEATDSFVSNSRFRIEAAHLMDEIIDGTIAGVEWVGE
jgi:hypothetical protein